MSVAELEQELARVRDPSVAPSGAVRLSVEEALAFRSAGNMPDDDGRSLRIVLHIRSAEDVRRLSERRLEFEPDFHEAPTWRRDGSKPVNVVPLRLARTESATERDWWEEPDVAQLEAEWLRTGTVDGIKVPEGYRSFVYKTVLALRAANHSVTVETIADSVARWLTPEDAATLRSALEAANA
jgi:hypothetical protein